MRFSLFLALAGILVWILVTVWDFVAPELTATLLWARLATPVISNPVASELILPRVRTRH
jgi:hypothetical protein